MGRRVDEEREREKETLTLPATLSASAADQRLVAELVYDRSTCTDVHHDMCTRIHDVCAPQLQSSAENAPSVYI